MSCLYCSCGRLIDTDEDPEAIFDTETQRDVIACESCRETHEIIRELNHRANEADHSLKDYL